MIDYTNPDLVVDSTRVRSGRITWKSPSNIAIIKYWGKFGNQLPCNPSLSFTLDHAHTETTVEYGPRMSDVPGISVDFLFHKKPNQAFAARIKKYLTSLLPIFPFLNQLELTIFSSNSFPHSTGIASSASAMSALALCICSIEDELFGTLASDKAFDQKASYIARLGSGSASRSIFGKAALWGETEHILSSSDFYAIGWEDQLHPVFHDFRDDILIVNQEIKSVSSSAGHQLMENNPFASPRYETANTRLIRLIKAMRNGDIDAFGEIAEQEAMTLHGLMMLSEPGYILMQANTLTIIEKVRQFRVNEKVPIYFTLDAGPNVHLLYPDSASKVVHQFITNDLLKFCHQGSFIADRMGLGPSQL